MSGALQNDIDDVFERIGGFGRFQIKTYFLMNLVHVVCGFHTMALTFIGPEVDWNCGKAPNLEARCLQYGQEKCEPEYNPTASSIVSEWNLICDKSSLTKLSQSMFFIGAMFGAWLWGTVSDRIGRRKVFFITVVLSAAFGFGYSLSPSYYIFLAFRFLIALSMAGTILSSFVLSMEITGKEYRTFAGLACSAVFALCFPLLAGLAYLIPKWRMLGVVISPLFLLFLLLWKIIPESPRWLLVQGREEEAKAVLSRIASGNGEELPAGQLKNPSAATLGEPISVLDLFRGRVIRQRTLVLFAAWFSNCMLYYALSMSAGDLGGSRYFNFSLSGLVEVPSIAVSYVLLQRFGRRLPHSSFLAGGGVACLSVTLLEWLGSSAGPKIVLAMVGKFAIAGSFAQVYLYTAELFPTQVRNIGAGVSTIGARLGGIFSPIVLLLASYGAGLPMLILGVLGTLAGLLSLTLPETLNQPLPETLRELES